MIKKTITSMDEILKIVSDQPFDSRNGRYRGYYLYRGLSRDYNLKTSLYRNCKEKSMALEKPILDNFAKYAETELMQDRDNIWRRMIMGQHHGLPTRLLDWTRSPFVALHFAVSDALDQLDKNNGILWRIDIEKIHDKLPNAIKEQKSIKGTEVFSVDMLNNATSTIEQYDRLTNGKSMVIMEPPSIDPRIINQYSFFSVIPGQVSNIDEFLENYTDDEDAVAKYTIDKNLKWRLRDFLDESNISERTVYPGLDGVCQWLSRHYYVKESSSD